jgi:flavodoxin
MKVAIRYCSRGGNVKAMAEAIARGTGVEAISIDEPDAQITKHVDLLFIGGALYKYRLDPFFQEYLENLPEGLIDEAVCFGSSMLTRRPVFLIQERLKAKGIKLNKQALWSRNHPNDDLIGVIEYFAQNEVTRDRSLDGLPPYLVFKRSQELKERREAEKALSEEERAELERQKEADKAREAAEAARRAADEAQAAAEEAAAQAAEALRLAQEKAEEAAAASEALQATKELG